MNWLNIFKLILIIILSNLLLLFLLYYVFPISMPWATPRQVFSNTKIEDKSVSYARLNEFSSDASKAYEKAKISSIKILKDGAVVWWAALVSQDWYFLSAKHIFSNWNFQVLSYYWDRYNIQNIWFDESQDLLIWKLIYTGWKLDNFSLIDENFSPNLWAYVWVIGYPENWWKDFFSLANIVSFWDSDSWKNYIIDKKLLNWNSGWSVFDMNWNLMWIVSSSLPSENFSYILPINQWLVKNLIAMSKSWKLMKPVLDFQASQNSYELAKTQNLDDFGWYVVTLWNSSLKAQDIIYSVNWIKLTDSKNIFQALIQSQLSGVAKFEVLRNKQKSILSVPINFQ